MMFHSIVVYPRLLKTNMSKPIPLRTALRIERDYIVVSTYLIHATRIPFLEIDDLLVEFFSPSNTMRKVVEAKIELTRLSQLDLFPGLSLYRWCQQVQCYITNLASGKFLAP